MFSAKDLVFAKGPAGGYTIAKSLRFRSSASAYLSRTPGSASDQKKWTFSAWVKRGQLGTTQIIAEAGTSGSTFTYIAYFNSSDQLVVLDSTVSGVSSSRTTAAVFRDPSAWYHIVVYLDAANATSKVYVNNVEQTCTGTQPSNQNWAVNSAIEHRIGRAWGTNTSYFDGYLSEVNFIDGQALTPSSFGQTDTATGVWMPKAYTGTYGTNGFYLQFTDVGATSGSNTGYGKDFSGNSNYWTTNNLSSTAGVTYDSMVDTPTNFDNGVTGAGNYCTLNPLSNQAAVPSGGNLNIGVSSPDTRCNSTMFVSSGKWYFEVTLNTAGTNTNVGIGQNNITNAWPGNDPLSYAWELDNARKANNGTLTSYGTALTAGQVFMCAIDLDNLKLFFGGQGTWFASSDPVSGANPAFTLTAGLYCAISRPYGGSASVSFNFGQRPFSYTPPTGFKALCTQNLPTPTIGATSSTLANKYFDATTYTGNGSVQTAVNSGSMQPDFLWIKGRSGATDHQLLDIVRGTNITLASNSTAGDVVYGSAQIAFNSNGFTVGGLGTMNTNAATYVGWQWKANGSGSSNTSGTITSTVSANVTAGFSVVTWTGTGANATVGHGLGVAPRMIIAKVRTTTDNWIVYHASTGNTGATFLNLTNAFAANAAYWNNTSPTSTVFTTGTWFYGSPNTYVAYCFAEVAGYSKFGSYTGNGSADGPFVYCGFRPRFIMLKRTDSTSDWYIMDTARSPINVETETLRPNLSASEVSGLGAANTVALDGCSNGFKFRDLGSGYNASGGTYIYAAFAENPFNYSRAR